MTFAKVLSLVVLLVAYATASPLLRTELAKITSSNRAGEEYRLPNNTAPISYEIRLDTNIGPVDFRFYGEARIRIQVSQPTSNITVHTSQLTFNESLTTLISEAGIVQNITSHTYDTTHDFLIINVENVLPVGNYSVFFAYNSTLSDDMYGYYRSSYINAEGNRVWLATTQFEATYARRAFPCFDEPGLKATFNIGIKHQSDYHALSNMPIASSTNDPLDGKNWTIFQTTPVMSSYLIAFIVSDYAAIQNSDESYNVWTKPTAIAQVRYAFDVGQLELAELERYTGVNYTLPKMDQASIPDFQAGAMENWGLVTYRETMFFYDENVTTSATRQSISSTISHEFGHQWFGDLVSPAWWKYLWLNEGFATFFQYITTDEAEENWRMSDQFVIRAQQASAFIVDSTPDSHPMNAEVSSPGEISAIFDSISYRKAACVIRMMANFLTEDVFRAGLTRYLNDNAYGAVTSDDLFRAMEEAKEETSLLPHVHVKEVMDTWVNQMGYPVVTVTRNYTTSTTEVTQERFLSENGTTTDDHDYKWWIPINWVSQTSPVFTSTVATSWIRAQDDSVIVSGLNPDGWVIFNKQQTGYYRVNYDETNWGLIAAYLNSDSFENIHVLNRAALIDDSINLALAQRLPYTTVFNLMAYLQREVDYVPWYAAFTGLTYLNRVLSNTEQSEQFRIYMAFLTEAVYESVGVTETANDEHPTRLHRINVVNYACQYGVQNCRDQTQATLINWLNNPTANPISSDLKTNTICAGLRSANVTVWNRALDAYSRSNSSTDRTALLAGLGCNEDETIINNWLNAIITPATGLSRASSSSAFISVYQGSPYNVDRAFDFLVANFSQIIDYFGSQTQVRTFLTGISYRLTTPAQQARLQTFVTAQSTILGSATVATSLAYVEANLAWSDLHIEGINQWLITVLPGIIDPTTTTTEGSSSPATSTQSPTDESTTTEQSTEVPTSTEGAGGGAPAVTASFSFFAAVLVGLYLI